MGLKWRWRRKIARMWNVEVQEKRWWADKKWTGVEIFGNIDLSWEDLSPKEEKAVIQHTHTPVTSVIKPDWMILCMEPLSLLAGRLLNFRDDWLVSTKCRQCSGEASNFCIDPPVVGDCRMQNCDMSRVCDYHSLLLPHMSSPHIWSLINKYWKLEFWTCWS